MHSPFQLRRLCLFQHARVIGIVTLLISIVAPPLASGQTPAPAAFNIKTYGATGNKPDNAQAAIQKAIDACAAAGGGMVYFPPGQYTSGTLHLHSHVRLFLETGATLFSIKEKSAFDKEALIYGEDLEQISIEGRGKIDGQAEYEWRADDIEDDFIRPNKELMLAQGKPITRSFPKTNQYGKLVLLVRCKDIRITGISLVDSPSWTIHPVGCERLVIDGVYIRSSQKDGVWADGIDPDGCKDVRIANCTIETGDDAIVFYSMNWFGEATPCENITVTNCRLSSSSSAIKFCDGNMNAIRNVTIDNCVITNSNRGIAFMDFDGGVISDVLISNVVIDCVRHDWFWWGDGDPLHFNIKRRSEVHKSVAPGADRPAGRICRVSLQNIIARGQGESVCNGHPDQWLEDITLDNVKLYLSSDAKAPYDKAVHALTFRQARNLKLKDVEIAWRSPGSPRWTNAVFLDQVHGLVLDGVACGPAPDFGQLPATSKPTSNLSDQAAIVLSQVEHAVLRNCDSRGGLGPFLLVQGASSNDILLYGNHLPAGQAPYARGAGVGIDAVREATQPSVSERR